MNVDPLNRTYTDVYPLTFDDVSTTEMFITQAAKEIIKPTEIRGLARARSRDELRALQDQLRRRGYRRQR